MPYFNSRSLLSDVNKEDIIEHIEAENGNKVDIIKQLTKKGKTVYYVFLNGRLYTTQLSSKKQAYLHSEHAVKLTKELVKNSSIFNDIYAKYFE